MTTPERLQRETIEAGLAGLTLWHPPADVAAAALPIIALYREIAPLGERLLDLPPQFAPAHVEVLLLLRHLAESLGGLRPQAQLIMEAFAAEPEAKSTPDFASRDTLPRMITCLDDLAPVAALPDGARSLFPLHLAEIVGTARKFAAYEEWLAGTKQGTNQLALFLWKLAASLEYDLARTHIFDRCASEPGVLTLIDTVLAESGDSH